MLHREYQGSTESRPTAGGWAHFQVFLSGMWFLAVLGLLLGSAGSLRAQVPTTETGLISGRVSNSYDGKGLPAATVTIRGMTLATQTDADGNYTMTGVPPGNHVVQYFKPGFVKLIVENVQVITGQTSRSDAPLKPDYFLLETFEVVEEPLREEKLDILAMQQKSVNVTVGLGSAEMASKGASDVAEAMTKVTGATVVDGKFAVIRGLSDRYTTATLNGAEIPSADPYRKSAQLDMFPSSMIERMTVNKTFTPDLPGGFTGGSIDIQTKSFPEKFFYKFSVGTGFNTSSSLNEDYLTYPGGRYDWAATDDGVREMPGILEGVTTFPNPNSGPPATRQAAADQMLALTTSFGSPDMGGKRDTAPMNYSFNTSVGDTQKVLDRRFGYFASLSYERKFNFYDDGVQARYYAELPNQPPTINQQFKDVRGTEEVAWSGLVNLAYELSEGNEVSFTFLYNQNADDVARLRYGKVRNLDHFQPGATELAFLNTLHYTERNLNAFQFNGRHELATRNLVNINWLVSLAGTSQDEPDLRYLNYTANPNGTDYDITLGNASLPQPFLPTRYYRNLEEQNLNWKFDVTVPYEQWSGEDGEFKFGYYQSNSQREFRERTFSYDGQKQFTGDPFNFGQVYLDPSSIGYTVRFVGPFPIYTFSRSINSQLGNNKYEASQQIQAGYVMTELPLGRTVRLVSGVRRESTDLDIDSTAANLAGTFKGSIQSDDWLPAAGFIFKIRTNMNVRVHWSQTLARPTYREFASYRSYDVTGDEILQGNPNLKLTHAENYDLRWEWFPNPGDVLSVGGFYKKLTQPIEKVALDRLGDVITYTNQPTATVFGAEFELRKGLGFISSLMTNLSFGANFAWIQSEVANTPKAIAEKTASTGFAEKTRPLFDQSPYVLNVDLSYENRRSGTQVTVAFNQSGERLYLVNEAGYDVYEQPAPQLDLIFSQRLNKHWKLRLSAKNLLNPAYERIYGRKGDFPGLEPYGSYKRGITFGIGLGAEF